tara:strand:- start:192 stop:431 length:240 start_codon:yes stop_codon:yes gene_type:complete
LSDEGGASTSSTKKIPIESKGKKDQQGKNKKLWLENHLLKGKKNEKNLFRANGKKDRSSKKLLEILPFLRMSAGVPRLR